MTFILEKGVLGCAAPPSPGPVPHLLNRSVASPPPPRGSFNPTGLLMVRVNFYLLAFYTAFPICHQTQIEIYVHTDFMAYRNWKSDKINIVRWWWMCDNFNFKAIGPPCRVNYIYTTGRLNDSWIPVSAVRLSGVSKIWEYPLQSNWGRGALCTKSLCLYLERNRKWLLELMAPCWPEDGVCDEGDFRILWLT